MSDRPRTSSIPLALLVLLAVDGGAAQVTVAEDARSDVAIMLPTGPATLAVGFEQVDLRSLRLVESLDSFGFQIQVQQLDPEAQGNGPAFQFGFRHYTTEFRLTANLRPTAMTRVVEGQLERRAVGAEEWDFVQRLPNATADAGLPGLTWDVPRALLADEDGTPPISGRKFEDFWAQSSDSATRTAIVGPAPTVSDFAPIQDLMPDSGFSWVAYDIQLGLAQGGTARLGSARPGRASNGEETTYLFQFNVTNDDQRTHTYVFDIQGGPVNWNITLPTPLVRLGASQSTSLSVVVATSFAHQHAGYQNFSVVAQNLDDERDQSQLAFSVLYLAVPQPSGHHPLVVLHSKGTPTVPGGPIGEGDGVSLYLNTLVEDDLDVRRPIRAIGDASGSPTTGAYRWCGRLEPGLAIGLAFDMARLGLARLQITSVLPMQGNLSGALVLAEPDSGQGPTTDVCFGRRPVTPLAELMPVEADFADGPTVELPIRPLAGAEPIPYAAGTDLFLDLRLRTDRPAGPTLADAPLLQPGGTLLVPLQEYHERVEAEADSPQVLRILGPSNLHRNPGSAAVVAIELSGAEQRLFNLEILGTRREWASLHGPNPLGSSQRLHLVVDVPDDALDGEIANLLVMAKAVDNPLDIQYVRAVVEVDEDAQHGDDRALADELVGQRNRQTPSSSVLASVLALLAFSLLLGWGRPPTKGICPEE